MTTAALDIRTGRSRRYPAGPSFLPRVFSGRMFRQNAIESMGESARLYGDLVHYTIFGRHIYQLNHPELIEDFLVRDAGKHHRGIVMQRAKIVLGELKEETASSECVGMPGPASNRLTALQPERRLES